MKVGSTGHDWWQPRAVLEPANTGRAKTDGTTAFSRRLRQKHATGGEAGRWFGVDVDNEGVCDCYETFVWEPLIVKVRSS